MWYIDVSAVDGADALVDRAKDSIGIPITNEAKLVHGTRPVSAIALDTAAARLVTGALFPQCCSPLSFATACTGLTARRRVRQPD